MRKEDEMKRNATIRILLPFLLTFLLLPLTGCGETESTEADASNAVYVYNWGDYVDPDVLDMFEEETGIRVYLDEFDTNEDMYPKIASGASEYDVVCPSDYMIAKMIQNDLLQPLDYDLLPLAQEYTGQEYWEQAKAFDPGNRYTVPYCWGTIGIMYNRTMVDRPVDSWDILWDPAYRDDILMQDSVRDTFMVALRRLGYSLNTTDPAQLEEAKQLLIEQKPLVQAYVVDEARDKLVAGESAMGVVFSGEALWMIQANDDLAYTVPKEGTNLWIDGWVIPKNARNVNNAHAFIDYMCRPDIAALNCEYLTYSTPNTGARDYIEDEDVLDSEELFPDLSRISYLEAYSYLGEDMDKLYSELWIQLKSA